MKNKLRLLSKFALITLALPTYASDMQFKSGWNLVGYTGGTTINVEEIFGTAAANNIPNVTSNITSVWKWVNGEWQFWTPVLTSTELATYAAGKGYQVLVDLQPGDGYWINAKSSFIFNNFNATPTKLGVFETLRKVDSGCHGYTFNPNETDIAIALSGAQLSITEDDFFDKRCVYSSTSITSPLTGTFRCANNNFDEGTFTLTDDRQSEANDIRLTMDVVTTNRACNYQIKFVGFRK